MSLVAHRSILIGLHRSYTICHMLHMFPTMLNSGWTVAGWLLHPVRVLNLPELRQQQDPPKGAIYYLYHSYYSSIICLGRSFAEKPTEAKGKL